MVVGHPFKQRSQGAKVMIPIKIWLDWVILGLYRGYIGIMEKKMETTIMENQVEEKMGNEMETGIIMGYI